MKKLVITSTLALLAAAWSMVGAQDYPAEYLGLPGDNLNLYATMKLFQESETLEGFEKSLNDENSRINNLDLNGDNRVDYIMVFDYVDGDVHSIVLRTALNRKETQDVAVFTVQRFSNGSVQIQLVGDEALYGRNYIVEPIYADYNNETPNPGYRGNKRNVTVVRTTTYEIAAWPVIRYIYYPGYVTWNSSWSWDYYPVYWNPWRPFYWHTYYGYHYNMHNYYYTHYRAWNYHRCNYYNDFYYSNVRTYSPVVKIWINNGNYKNTYSRPDLRKEGEALYVRTNPAHNARTRDNASTAVRRTNNSPSVQGNSPENYRSGTERSSATNVNRRSASGAPASQGTEISRKSAAAGSNRNIENGSAGRATDISRSVTTERSARSATSQSVQRETNVSRKSGEVSNNREVKSSPVDRNSGNTRRAAASVYGSNDSGNREAPRSVRTESSQGHVQTKSAASAGSSENQSRTSVSSGRSDNSNRSSGERSESNRTSSSGNSGRR